MPVMWHCSVNGVKPRSRSMAIELTRKYLRFAKDLRAAEDATTRQSLYMTPRTDEKSSSRGSRPGSPLHGPPLMVPPHSSSPAPEAPPRARSSAEQATLVSTLVHLWPYIWPSDRVDLKMRVMWSVVLLLVAKLATLAVP